MSFNLDDRINARRLFVESGMSYEEVAAETGVSLSALKNWGKEGKWTEEREEYEREILDISARLRKTTLKKVKEIEADPNDQKIYALRTLLQATFNKSRAKPVDKARLYLDWLEKLLGYLKAEDAEALRYLQPHLAGFAETIKGEE